MKRLVATGVVGFGVLMLMLRGFETARANVASSSEQFEAVDGVLQTASQASVEAIPLAFLVAAIAIILWGAR